jgi:competence protein ComEC
VTVTTKVEPTIGGVRFSGSAQIDGATARVSVRLTGGEAPDGLDLGARVSVTGGGEPTDPGESAAVIVFARSAEVVRRPPHVFGLASALRHGFVDEVIRGLPDPGGGLLPGLSVGETSAVSDELDAQMKASSLSHLTAVSGSNCSLVVGLAYGACALCGLGRRTRIVVATAVLAGFVVLVTPEASVIRAAAMSAIGMFALLLGRRGAGIAVLALAVTVLVIADPWISTSFGFLLSASATGALLLLAEPLARGLGRWMPRALALGIAVPLSAQLVCGPIIVLFAPEVALYGVVANMIAGPGAPLATVLGLVACLAQPVPPLALGAAALAWLPSAWIAQTAETFAALPAARLGWSQGWLGFTLLTLVGAACVIVACRLRPRWLRRVATTALAVLVGTGTGMVTLSGVAGPLTAPRDWSIALCDVGQGDAILLRSAGHTAIVDTGPDVRALETCLSRLGVDDIDVAFLTHFDADHVTGVPALAGRAHTIIHGPASEPGELADAQAVTDDVREGSAGLSGRLGAASWRILWPRAGSRAFDPGNDTSLVLEIAGPDLPHTILLGDLGEDAQRLLATGASPGPVDVVKVSHHGSRDHSPGLYAALRPRIALIGVGENDYGHPHPDLLATLARSGARVARSDTDGLVLVSTRAGELTLWREHPPSTPTARGAGTPHSRRAYARRASRRSLPPPPPTRRRGSPRALRRERRPRARRWRESPRPRNRPRRARRGWRRAHGRSRAPPDAGGATAARADRDTPPRAAAPCRR